MSTHAVTHKRRGVSTIVAVAALTTAGGAAAQANARPGSIDARMVRSEAQLTAAAQTAAALRRSLAQQTFLASPGHLAADQLRQAADQQRDAEQAAAEALRKAAAARIGLTRQDGTAPVLIVASAK